MSGRPLTRAACAVATLLATGIVLHAAAQASTVVTSLTLFAGNQAGLWRSTDWGGTWTAVKRSPLDELGAAYSILPLGARVYLGGAKGLFSSDDFGETWQQLAPTLSEVRAVLPSRYIESDPTVFVGTSGGLFKSTDAGKTFAPTPIKAAVERLEWPGPALVAVGQGVFVTEDGAKTVRTPMDGLPPGLLRAMAVSSFFMTDPVMFVSVDGVGVFRSSDGGKHFVPAGLANTTVNDLVWLGPILYAATETGLYRSEDIGKRWEKIGEGLPGRNVRRLLFPLAPASGAEIFAATDAGIFHSGDGGVRFDRGALREQSIDVLATFPPPQPVNRRR